MPIKVLLSIKPEFTEKIFNGTKRFEFRRSIFRNQDVACIVVYASSPISKIVGEFQIQKILELEIENLWKKTEEQAGITKSYFDEYFNGRDRGYAIEIWKAKLYEEPLELEKAYRIRRAPQSFMYLE